MITFLKKYDRNTSFENEKENIELNQDHYVAYTSDNDLVHVAVPLENYFSVMFYSGDTREYASIITKNNKSGTDKTEIDLSDMQIDEIREINAPYGFYISISPNMYYNFYFQDYNTKYITDMSEMFGGYSGYTSIDLSNFDTSNVTDMSNMFNGLKVKSLDLSSFDTSKVTDMSSMFSDCTELTYLDVSNFDTSNVTSMSYMFYNCYNYITIKCKQDFQDWCYTNQDTIKLPSSIYWEIVE